MPTQNDDAVVDRYADVSGIDARLELEFVHYILSQLKVTHGDLLFPIISDIANYVGTGEVSLAFSNEAVP
jgi:hypothetical protein